MKSCPTCLSTYSDESLNYCLLDRSLLRAGGLESTMVDPTEVPTVVRQNLSLTKEYVEMVQI